MVANTGYNVWFSKNFKKLGSLDYWSDINKQEVISVISYFELTEVDSWKPYIYVSLKYPHSFYRLPI